MVYLGEPVAVEDRPVESLLFFNVGEVFESNHVNVIICPPSLFIINQPEEKGLRCATLSPRTANNNFYIKCTEITFTHYQNFLFFSILETWTHLSWKRRRASWAQIRMSPSTGRVSRGRRASKMPLTQRVISLGE